MAVFRGFRVGHVLSSAMLELMPLDGSAFRRDRRTDVEKHVAFSRRLQSRLSRKRDSGVAVQVYRPASALLTSPHSIWKIFRPTARRHSCTRRHVSSCTCLEDLDATVREIIWRCRRQARINIGQSEGPA
jgi:hypothetical protein